VPLFLYFPDGGWSIVHGDGDGLDVFPCGLEEEEAASGPSKLEVNECRAKKSKDAGLHGQIRAAPPALRVLIYHAPSAYALG